MSIEKKPPTLHYEVISGCKGNPNANTGRFLFTLESGSLLADVASLRKILFSGLDGVAVRAFSVSVDLDDKVDSAPRKVDSAPHKYYALDNLREDMPSLVKNLRKIVLKGTGDLQGGDLILEREFVLDKDLHDEEMLPIMERVVSCADFSDVLQSQIPSATFVNDEYIATLVRERDTQEVKLTLRLVLDARTGFVNAEENHVSSDPLNVIPIDAQHSPVIRCAMHEDGGNVIVEIETNGAITPEEAVEEALARLPYRRVFLEY